MKIRLTQGAYSGIIIQRAERDARALIERGLAEAVERPSLVATMMETAVRVLAPAAETATRRHGKRGRA